MNITEKRLQHLKEVESRNAIKNNSKLNEAPVEAPTNKLDIDITNLTDIKRAYAVLKSGFGGDLNGILWNKSTVISIIVGLLIAEKMKQSAPNNNRTLLIPLIKKLKERYKINDEFIEKFISQKFTKLKGFSVNTTKLDYLIDPKSVTNEALFSIEDINKIVDKVASKHTKTPIDQQTSETGKKMNEFPHMVYVEKAWSILGSFSRLNISNFDAKMDMIERKIFQFKALRQQEDKDTTVAKKMDTIQNYMFVMVIISLLDDYKLTVADFKNKIVSKEEKVTETLQLESKTQLKPLNEIEVQRTMGYIPNNATDLSLAVYDKIEPQYIEWLIQFQGQVLQNDFGRWQQFFEFSFKNAMKKIAEQDRMFIEIMKIVFDNLKSGN